MSVEPSRPPLWSFYGLCILGLWMIFSPMAFGYESRPMGISDFSSGLLLIFFSLFARKNPKALHLWLMAGIGIWLQFAPLLFWAHNGAGYLNNTLIGSFVIALSVICFPIPGQPPLDQEPSIPPGWSYNPSSWAQRFPIALLALACWFCSRYLAAYQLGYIDVIWDPFFVPGTKAVLESSVSKAFPVSDAGLGAFAYTMEFFSTLQGGTTRWRTSPWLVLIFGLLVIPVSVVSTLLIILQPLAVGTWCTLCLATAVLMLIGIPLAVDEVAATLQFLKKERHRGFFKVLFLGGPCNESTADRRSPSLAGPLSAVWKASLWGVSFPKGLVVSTVLGIAIMALPGLLRFETPMRSLDPILGALTIIGSVVAFSEIARSFRWFVCFCGIAIGACALAFYTEATLALSHIGLGALIALCAIPRGVSYETF